MTKDVIVTIKSLRGFIAQWAVTQSPYACPDGLAAVLAEVTRRFAALPTQQMMDTAYLVLPPRRITIQAWLETLLFDIPQVQAWNTRKNGREGMGVAGRGIVRPDPDDDFIDLYALAQNVTTSMLLDNDHSCVGCSTRLLEAR